MFVLAMEFSRACAFDNSQVSGGHGGGVTPVPIPNTEVKPASADGTWGETPWESRSPPDFSWGEGPSGPSPRVRPGPPRRRHRTPPVASRAWPKALLDAGRQPRAHRGGRVAPGRGAHRPSGRAAAKLP